MASKAKSFLDTDVTLDHLADRQPFAEYAHRFFALVLAFDRRRAILRCSSDEVND